MNYTTKELGSSPQTLILHDMGLPWKTAEGDQYWNTWRFAKWAKKKDDQMLMRKGGELNLVV